MPSGLKKRTFLALLSSNGAIFILVFAYLVLRFPPPEFFLSSLDHGYQLAMGAAVVDGRLPGIDYFTLYGPLVGITSGLGLALTGTLAGEIVICASAYAAAICCASAVVRRHATSSVGVVCAVALLSLISRYYKWYYWLFPLTGLVFFQGWLTGHAAGARRSGLLVCWGVVAGLGFLYRFDLGLVAGCVASAMLILTRWAGGGSPIAALWRATPDASFFLIGYGAVLLLWFALGTLVGGSAFVPLFFDTAFSSTTGVVEHYAIRPFAFDLNSPLSTGNALAALQVLLPLTYAVAFLVGLRRARQVGAAAGADLMLAAASLLGLGLLPQGFQRSDVPHLLQVIAPAVIVLLLVAHRAATASKAQVLLALPVAVLLACLMPAAGTDLGPPIRDWLSDWRRLIGLPYTMPGNPVADIAIALRDATRPDEPVFIATAWTNSPILVLSRRHLAGLQPVYAPGILATPEWLERNRLALSGTPPRILVVMSGEWEQAPAGTLAPYLPDIIETWRREFTVVRHENDKFRLLERPL